MSYLAIHSLLDTVRAGCLTPFVFSMDSVSSRTAGATELIDAAVGIAHGRTLVALMFASMFDVCM